MSQRFITKFRCRDNDTDEEPFNKKPCLVLKKLSDCQTGRKIIKPTVQLGQLPDEILQKILGYINIWHFNQIRAISKRFRDTVDTFIMHEFEKAYQDYINDNEFSYCSAALRCIKVATETYVKSGYQSTFCGCLLPMLRSSYHDPFCPRLYQIQKFLKHFYVIMDDKLGDVTSQKSRLLYNITLLHFLKTFETIRIVSSEAKRLHWRGVVEFKGPWFGMLWSSKQKSPHQEVGRSNLLIILAEMLIADITGRAYRRVWENSSEVYVCGNDVSNTKRVPRTLVTLTVHGGKKICTLFRNCLENNLAEFQWPIKWPKDQFTITLNISCKEAMKWGCCKSQHLVFSPFAKNSDSDDEDSIVADDLLKNDHLESDFLESDFRESDLLDGDDMQRLSQNMDNTNISYKL